MPALPSSVPTAVLDTTSTALLTTAENGEVTWYNRAAQRLGQLIGTDIGSLPFGAATPDGPPVELRCPTVDGVVRHLRVTCRRLPPPPRAEPEPDGQLVYELADVTEQRADRRRADDYAWRLAHIEQLARVGTWEWHLPTDQVVWSPTLKAMIGLAPETALDYPTYRKMIHPDDVEMIEATLDRAIREANSFTYTHRMYLANSRQMRVLECYGEVFTDDSGRPLRMLGTAHDITEIRQVQDELAYLAEHDPLTGLPNRRALTARMSKLTAAGGPAAAALLLIDIDNFKDINDLRGHAIGDEVLRLLARLLPNHLPAEAVLGRLGGDEFAVLLPDCDADRALAIGAGLCDLVARTPLAVRGEPLRVTLSIGAAPLDTADDDTLLLAHADLALYQAKGEGRNRARLFAPEQQRLAAQRVDLVSRVRRALDTGQLQLDAQPIIDLGDDQVRSYELLMRVRDNHRRQIGPGDFLPALERGDMIYELDRWVVETATGALAAARAAGVELRLDVNISSRSLEDPSFGDWVVGTLAAAGVPATQLGLEITETTAIANLAAARRLASTLTSAGCRFSLDDFGAGYGSFVYLKHLPFSAVKIAGEFVRQADHGGSDPILIDAVVRAAHGLGMRTVAEHIDRPELVPVLRELGVDRGQGYHLGRPEPLHELMARTIARGGVSATLR
ncbi:putative bifunctional diguanylate cyclase/phosphodiesterase [Plantactinospora sp. KLBMP9567]|uniref:putative bifunctional diguanylate cyclase/phosphodiesterase n=1 Tax=Plantactinospora sp. KLBMP9567 TaxID=3085900 RepID=UPI002982248C|nr:EAL domain-containing protein [Plantactinospora sp. KLBMP9567]MDW5328074.1 EAL domain-containing protein [Plantactinospora sp. KLBMP9567]